MHETIGYNFKFTELQAVVGCAQMTKLPERVDRKKEILRKYIAGCTKGGLLNPETPRVRFWTQDLDFTTPWFIDLFIVETEEEARISVKDPNSPDTVRSKLMAFMKSQMIGTRMMYPPIHKQVCYQSDEIMGAGVRELEGNHKWADLKNRTLPVSEMVGRCGVWLPSQCQLTDAEIDCITVNLSFFLGGKGE